MTRPHPPPEPARPRRDGLAGSTPQEREVIAARIERVRAAKERVAGRPLSPAEIILALDPTAADRPLRHCTRCLSKLPESEFYAKSAGRLRSECITCTRRNQSRREATPESRDRRRERSPKYRGDDRRRKQAARAALRASGLPDRAGSARDRLMGCRKRAGRRMRDATDPAVRARLQAYILNLTHEIERIDREANS